ncbi:hypothetical protein B0H16DRAFT_1456225 [Mycena metata]|uniref:Uncharacterized protein n=1 Tax=Mycena metata TaxID=1033252 RepID=A0AAD7JAU4_9AGAR|nr:hypothetical protein B0H16DRAFT_1456225 [Mycena metata]
MFDLAWLHPVTQTRLFFLSLPLSLLRMDLKCDNSDCPSREAAPKFLVCSGCSTVRYFVCERAGDALDVNGNVGNSDSEKRNIPPERFASEMRPAIVDVKIENTTAQETVVIGTIKIQVIDIAMTNRNGGFFGCVNKYSHELGKLALQFDAVGRLHYNEGCWQQDDFEDEQYLVYLERLIIEPAWQGKGLEALNGAQYIFTWPSVLTHLEPPLVNGWFGNPTPAEEAAWIAKRDRIIRFYRKDTSHPSHTIPVEYDAHFQELAPAETEARRGDAIWHIISFIQQGFFSVTLPLYVPK